MRRPWIIDQQVYLLSLRVQVWRMTPAIYSAL
jgi:hypothetical protein